MTKDTQGRFIKNAYYWSSYDMINLFNINWPESFGKVEGLLYINTE